MTLRTHPTVVILNNAGFSIVPTLNMRASDTGLTAVRRDAHSLVVVTAWSDDFAVAARTNPNRDWSRPFASTVTAWSEPAPFADIVGRVLRGRHQRREDPAYLPVAQ